MTIRPTTRKDIPALKEVLEATELFPPEMLEGLLTPFLSGGESPDLWLTREANGQALGFCYAVPEDLTEGTWNMRAIAIHPSGQGKGHGAALTRHLEETLRGLGHRILIVDTSGTDAFTRTRAFYRKAGYTEEARIRDFWAEGDDKITFRRSLNGASP